MTKETVALGIPPLPHEIWMNIFEEATFVPNAFDAHAPDLFAYPGPWTQEQIQYGIRGSLCTRRRIVLVCKTWNMLATRLLYQAIPLTRPKSLERILRTLRGIVDPTVTDETDVPSDEFSNGRWTIRLDIALRREASLQASDFVDLLRRLPNLQVLVWRAPFHLFQSGQGLSLFDLFPTHEDRTLRVLDFCASDHPHTIDRLDAINGFPLRVLKIRPPSLSLWLGKRITLPEVEFLDAPPQLLRQVLTGEIPAESLSYLCVDDDYDAMWKVAEGRLSGMGHRLASLEIDDGSFRPVIVVRHLSVPEIDTLMRRVAESCPSLVNLIINVKSYGSLSHIDYLPPVRKLGLRLHITDATSKKWLKHLGEVLMRLILLTPSLEVIRLLGRPSFLELKKHHAGSLKVVQRLSVEFLSIHRVRFEDRTGRLFHDDRTAPNTCKLSSSLRLEDAVAGKAT